MNFTDLLETVNIESTLFVEDQQFVVAAIEKVKLASNEHLVWMWSENGNWLVVDEDGDEIIFLQPVEEEVEGDEEETFVSYRGVSFEESYEDRAEIKAVEGDSEHAERDVFLVKQYDGTQSDVLRRLTRAEDGEEYWFVGRTVDEQDIRSK